MSSGYVYVLSNPCMPGIVKIGHSNRSGRIRAAEIYTTGVPEPFKLEFEIFTKDCRELEIVVHEVLCDKRVSREREFFRVNVHEAIASVINEYTCAFDYCVVRHSDFIDPADLAHVIYKLGERGHSPFKKDAADLYCHIDDDAIEAAYLEVLRRRDKRGEASDKGFA